MKGRRIAAASVLMLAVACTTAGPSASPNPSAATSTDSSPSSNASPSSSAPTVLAGGGRLPTGCDARRPSSSESVAFVAGGRAWALDPSGGRLSCLFETDDPGPFAWGPRGDRVLLGGLQVVGFGKGTPTLPGSGVTPSVFDWGHPIGIAVVYAPADSPTPEKLLVLDDDTERLRDLPNADYLDVAYHPSGLALAFILERGGVQSIWFSTNEGEDPKRLVFTREGTGFSDVTFTHDGRLLVYMAHHTEGYSELHTIDLSRPDQLNSVWKGPVGEYVRTIVPSPEDRFFAATVGGTCEDERSVALVGRRGERTLLPEATEPSRVLGWLDDRTVLAGAGGCGRPLDLYAVSVTGSSAPRLLVSGVDAASSRVPAPPAPHSLPKEVQLDTGSGVG